MEVQAIAVNPVDTKMRLRSVPAEGQWAVLGWDAVGTVRAVGAQVTLFKPGDRVWYAGAIDRPGANAELHLVDERIAALAPSSLSRRRGRRAAADRHHRLGNAVRPPARVARHRANGRRPCW